ncbi:sigma-70 family RNA polymerase sigma factor [Mycolicibacterium litorale]|uniref:sigma-70 family RNA polymerase sigma factor n=1 Tax=Mycolicibacterium litorale TaxID=758802 RepID=UPI003CF7A2A7
MDPAEPPKGQQPGTAAEHYTKARGILAAWQRSAFRGWTIVEKRLDRARVIDALIAQFVAEDLKPKVLILAADDISRGQWLRLLAANSNPCAAWEVLTNDTLLAEHNRVAAEFVVVADEVDAYLSANLVAAISDVRAVLGLCASPRGLTNTPLLAKRIGRALVPLSEAIALDMSPLDKPHDDTAAKTGPRLDADEVREQLVTTEEPTKPLKAYLSDIRKIALLSAEEEIDLAKRIECGLYVGQLLADMASRGVKLPVQQRRDLQWILRDGQRAKSHFIEANLRLVVSLAKRYSSQIDIMDAIQEGNLGLIRAVEKFDFTKGYKFSTYATWWIRQAITRAIADTSRLIRIPVHMFESDSRVLAEWRRQSSEGPRPSAISIAAALDEDPDSVDAVLRRHHAPYSLELLIDRGFDLTDPEIEAIAHEAFAYSELQEWLHRALETLADREAGVIRLRFGLTDGLPHTLDEIGSIYGVTRERIRQIEAKAMLKLRHPFCSDLVRDFFEGVPDPSLVTDDSKL